MVRGNRVLGLDGGASKVRGIVVEQSEDGIFSAGSKAVTRSYAESKYYDPHFRPADLKRQFQEMAASSIIQTNEELQQEKAILHSFFAVIEELGEGRSLRLGIGLPGIKTKSGQGVAIMANGPRMPLFLEHLVSGLKQNGVRLDPRVPPLGSDSDFCGLGEEYARGGYFRTVDFAYYLGGGTGAAEALKLNGELVPFTQVKSWMPKLWELVDENGLPLETYVSMPGIQGLFTENGEKPSLYADAIFALAREGHEKARNTLIEVAEKIALILYDRIVTLACGHKERFHLRPFIRRHLVIEHPYCGSSFQRIVIGQRLATLFTQSRSSDFFYQPFLEKLENLISDSPWINAKLKQQYISNLKTDLICFSLLHTAPALGAGILAWQFKESS